MRFLNTNRLTDFLSLLLSGKRLQQLFFGLNFNNSDPTRPALKRTKG